jgi:hypothetical protein
MASTPPKEKDWSAMAGLHVPSLENMKQVPSKNAEPAQSTSVIQVTQQLSGSAALAEVNPKLAAASAINMPPTSLTRLEGPQAAKDVAVGPMLRVIVSVIVLVVVEVVTTLTVKVVVCTAVIVVDASTGTSSVLVTVEVLVNVDVIGNSVVVRVWRAVMVLVMVSNTSTSSSHWTELGYRVGKKARCPSAIWQRKLSSESKSPRFWGPDGRALAGVKPADGWMVVVVVADVVTVVSTVKSVVEITVEVIEIVSLTVDVWVKVSVVTVIVAETSLVEVAVDVVDTGTGVMVLIGVTVVIRNTGNVTVTALVEVGTFLTEVLPNLVEQSSIGVVGLAL